jgi:hypothetical protein
MTQPETDAIIAEMRRLEDEWYEQYPGHLMPAGTLRVGIARYLTEHAQPVKEHERDPNVKAVTGNAGNAAALKDEEVGYR